MLILLHHLQSGNTPLHEAVRHDRIAAAEALIAAGARMNTRNNVSIMETLQEGSDH